MPGDSASADAAPRERARLPFRPFSYDLIMADPPWPTRLRSAKGYKKSPEAHYPTMSIEAIAALPVNHLMAPNCLVFLWAVWPLLLDGGPGRGLQGNPERSPIGTVIKRWGLRYITGGAWHKRTKHGKTAFGPGYRVRSACEPFLICAHGRPLTTKSSRNLIEGIAREHSRKPDEAYAWCERLMPDARRADLFSRETRPGWDSWGDELGKFDQPGLSIFPPSNEAEKGDADPTAGPAPGTAAPEAAA